jgi:hypothetical protein
VERSDTHLFAGAMGMASFHPSDALSAGAMGIAPLDPSYTLE